MSNSTPAEATDLDEGQHTLVARRFGARADAYVSSAVHAAGPDLVALADLLRATPPENLLDLGCGGGHVSFTAAPLAGSVTAYDLSPDMLAVVARTARERGFANITTQQGPVEALPFADASFDHVVTRYSAHHWRDVPLALAEMRRVLKPGGRAVVMDVFAPSHPLLDSHLQTLEMLRDPSHVRNYDLAEWQSMLETAGFRPQVPHCWRLRLEFQSWVDRIGTPDLHRPALLSLQAKAAAEVKAHFAVEPDGTFTLDTMLIVAEIQD